MTNNQCMVCGTWFRSYNPTPKYCSRECKWKDQRAPVSFEKAKKLYEQGMTQQEVAGMLDTTQKVIHNLFRRNAYTCRVAAKRNQYGSSNDSWKGDGAGYQAFHRRLDATKGRPKKCEVCGTDNPTRTYDWANLTGKYDDPDDYKRMCRSCHWKYDKTYLNFTGGKNARAV